MYRSHAGIYGPSKPSSWLPTEASLFSTASMVGLREKLDTDPRITQLGWGLCLEPFFSGVVDLFKSVGDCAKSCNIRGLPARSVHGGYVNCHGKHTYHIDWGFPCRVYIDSNHCDSRT
jgi:hypothetical protein